jgi:hypothetical protein
MGGDDDLEVVEERRVVGSRRVRTWGTLQRRILELAAVLTVCAVVAWTFVPRYPGVGEPACGSPALDAVRSTGGRTRRSAEILGGEDYRLFVCKEAGVRALIQAAAGVTFVCVVVAGVLSAVSLKRE